MNLIDRLQSILTGSVTTLTALLSEPMTQPFKPEFIETFRDQHVSVIPVAELNAVAPTDLSIPYNSMKQTAASVTADADTVTIDITQLSRLVDGAVSTVARQVDRSRFRLDNIKSLIISEHENPSTFFTETFDNTSMTDLGETTATIRDGAMRSTISNRDDRFDTTPSLELINTPSSKVLNVGGNFAVSAISAGMAVSAIDGIGSCGAVMRSRHFIDSAQKATSITIVSAPKTKLARAYGLDGAGVKFDLDNPEITNASDANTYVFSFEPRVLTGIICISYSQEATVIDSAKVKAILTKKPTDPDPVSTELADRIRAIADSFKDASVASGFKSAYVYDLSISASVRHNDAIDVAERTSYWKSKPIKVEGDIKTLKLNAMQDLPTGTDVRWEISVNGSSFLNVVPVDFQSIASERLQFGTDGVAMFRFPVKKGTSYAIVEGLGPEATTADILSGSGDTALVVGIDVTGAHDDIGAVAYLPEIPEEIDLSAFGMMPDAPSVVEARTAGELGERFVSSSHRKIVLAHQPAEALTVYIGGTKATEIVDGSVDDPSLDPRKFFFQRFGREVRFNRDVYDITAYYNYPVSTVVLRATLTATPSAHSGPAVKSYTLSLTHV